MLALTYLAYLIGTQAQSSDTSQQKGSDGLKNSLPDLNVILPLPRFSSNSTK